MDYLTPDRITTQLQLWLASEKPDWRDIVVRPLDVTLGAGFSADIFFVDVDGHFEDSKVAKAIARLSETCSFVKILGSYPNSG